MKTKPIRQILSILLSLALLTGIFPTGAFAATDGVGLASGPSGIKSGSLTVNGQEFAVLYNDYIAVYVNRSDNGFAVLPAAETFDGTKPLSYATFRIDGREYRYGAHYDGISGITDARPNVGENNVLESHRQIGDFVISQIFAITNDTEHTNSYAVKIGYAAQYFGEGSANISGRILLDTQFTEKESVPVLLLDDADSTALVETEAKIASAPVSVSVSAELIGEEGLTDEHNKGYLVFPDESWTSPDSVIFAELGNVSGYDYEPDWEQALFDGANRDSAALLYWDEVNVDAGNGARFGTNYGFYDMERGNVSATPFAPVAMGALYAAADTETKKLNNIHAIENALYAAADTETKELNDIQAIENALYAAADTETKELNDIQAIENELYAATDTVTVYFVTNDMPEWFTIQSSLALTEETTYGYTWQADATGSEDFTVTLDIKPDTPQVIKDSVKEYHLFVNWSGDEDWYIDETCEVGEIVTISDYLKHKGDSEALVIGITPVMEPAEGYAYVSTYLAYSSDGATIALSGSDVQFYTAYTYFVKQGTTAKLTAEMKGTQYRPYKASEDIYEQNDNDSPYIQWGDHLYPGGTTTTLTAQSGDKVGPLTYEYKFTVPSDKSYGEITMGIREDTNVGSLFPINVKAYSGTLNDTQTRTVEGILRTALAASSNVTFESGVLWGKSGETITFSTDGLTGMDYSGYALNVYKAGTTTEIGSYSVGSFTMPSEAVDLVFEQGTLYRVLTEVTGGGTANVTVSPEKPKIGDTVNVYVTNIQDGYQIKSGGVTATGVTLTPQNGGSYGFTMPSSDVSIVVELETVALPGEPHSLAVKPLAGDGMTLWDVFFYADAANNRLPYEVDEAGRTGRIRAGATVNYRLYPTTWDNINTDIEEWVVDSFTIQTDDGEIVTTPDITPIASSLGYVDGSFTMPDADVVFSVTGHKEHRAQTLTVEAVTADGTPITLPESSLSYMVNGGSWNSIGLNSPIAVEIGNVVSLHVSGATNKYFLESAELVYQGFAPESISVTPGRAVILSAPQINIARNAVLRLVFAEAANRTLTVTGFNDNDDGLSAIGEVKVLINGDARRDITLLKDAGGQYTADVELRWDYPNLVSYALPTNSGAALISDGYGYKVYRVTLSSNTTLAISQNAIPASLNLGWSVPNSQYTGKFSTVFVLGGKTTAVGGGAAVNVKDLMSSAQAPKISKVSLVGHSGQTTVFPIRTTANNAVIMNAISYPDSPGRAYIDNPGEFIGINLRTLFGIAENLTFPDGEYTVAIEWQYGANYKETDRKELTFELAANKAGIGDITHLAAARKLGGNWIIVSGANPAQLEENALQQNAEILLRFTTDDPFGFSPEKEFMGQTHDFAMVTQSKSSVVMNGHAYFRRFVGNSAFIMNEDNGTVTITTVDMSFGSSKIDAWIPVQIGSTGSWGQVGSDTLTIKLEKGKSYTLPDEYPEYHTDGFANADDAKEAFYEEIEKLRADTLLIKPGDLGAKIEFEISGYEMKGLYAEIRDMYLLGHGIDLGGDFLIQIPGTKDPVFRVALVMLVTDNTAKLIPIDGVWAEGEGTFKLPDFIGGQGGTAFGEFNTFTQDFSFGAEVNFIISFAGEMYIKRSERLGIPILDSFSAELDAGDAEVGIGIPPGLSVIEITGINMGVNNFAALVDYDPRINTIPSLRFTLGANFALVKVLNFHAEMWAELLANGASMSGKLGIGPFSLPLLEELSLEYGVKDGPYDYEKSKRSLLFFINAACKANVFGIVKGGGSFYINMSFSPALWENGASFNSFQELVEFFDFTIRGGGKVYASANVPFTDWTIADSDVTIDIVFKPGYDVEIMPLGFKTFKFTSRTTYFGAIETEDELDLMKEYSGLETWIRSEVKKQKEKKQNAKTKTAPFNAQVSAMSALSAFMENPEASGLTPDPNYIGEHRIRGLGAVAADSETLTAAPTVGARTMRTMSVTQDTANITVDSDGTFYTHRVTVPNNAKNYVLMLEGYGGETLNASDLRAVKPNGQALTIREMTGEMTSEQAKSSYNAATIDDVLYLALNDYMNNTDGNTGKEINTSYDTLAGEWQIIAEKPFKSSVVEITPITGVKSVALVGNKVNAKFEAVGNGTGYYYDVALERKDASETAAIETYPVAKDVPITSKTATFDLNKEDGASGNDSKLQEILTSGDWYPLVTLRHADAETPYSIAKDDGTTESGSILITDYVDSMGGETPYTVNNTLLASAVWTPNLTTEAVGNQSIGIKFKAVTAPPTGMTVKSYHIAVYDSASGLIANKAPTDSDGNQTLQPVTADIAASEKTEYDFAIADLSAGSYKVGVTAVYGDASVEGETVSPVGRNGTEELSGSVTITASNPPTLTIGVSGGNLVEENGSKRIFAGSEEAELILSASDGARVTVTEIDGTPVIFGTSNMLVDYNGKSLFISATDPATKDSVTDIVTVYADLSSPLLLPDSNEATADKINGKYSITGQAAPGAQVGNATADDDGRFTVTGVLPAGADSDTVLLAVTSLSGNVTLCEIDVVRGTANPPPTKVGDLDGTGSVDVNDLLIILRFIAGKISLTPEQYSAADVDNSEIVDIMDLLMMLRYIAGKINTFTKTNL